MFRTSFCWTYQYTYNDSPSNGASPGRSGTELADLENPSPLRSVRPRLGDDAQVRLRRFPAVGIDFLRLFVRDRAGNDDVLAGLPVRGRRHAMLRRQLQGIDHPQHLVEIAPRCHRIDE